MQYSPTLSTGLSETAGTLMREANLPPPLMGPVGSSSFLMTPPPSVSVSCRLSHINRLHKILGLILATKDQP